MASKKPTTPYRQVYFGEKPILIEKNWKKWLGDPTKLEENLKVWFAENAKVMDENISLKKQLKEKDQETTNLKNSFDAEKLNWVNERYVLKSQADAANVSRETAWGQLNNSREFAKKTYVILGNYGTNPPLYSLDQLKWLLRKHNKPTTDKDYYTLYDLVDISPQKQVDKLNQFLVSQKVANLDELGQKIKGLATDKNNEINTILAKWKAKDLVELSASIQDTVKENKQLKDDKTQLITKKKELENKVSSLENKLKNKNDEINSLNSQANKLQKEVKNKDNIISSRDKDIEDLKTKLTEAQNTISQKDKTINNLQLKNEKLSESYKKLIQHLADARQLVSHLQKDLQTEKDEVFSQKQDKAHIQKELDDTLAIPNKPTSEMGTQTDLTAEQITQMEKDLAEQTTKITELNKSRDELTNQITQQETEINQLKEQAKGTKLNPAEEKLINIVPTSYYSKEQYGKFINFLNTGELDGETWDWGTLSKDPDNIFQRMKRNMLNNCQGLIKLRELEKEVETETKTRQQLQTKYDMEVRSKEELIKYLNVYRSSMSLDIDWSKNSGNDFNFFNDFHKQHDNLWFYSFRWDPISLSSPYPTTIDISNIKNLWKLWFFFQKKDKEITLRVANTNIKGFKPLNLDDFWKPSAVYTDNKNIKLLLVDYKGETSSPIYSKDVV